jgi:uncharacterized membrane protein
MKCYNHPEIDAIGFCTSCNKAICETCSMDVHGKLTCRECLASGRFNNQDSSNITDQDKIMALLSYIISLIVPIIILLSESSKNRHFQRYHAINSLVFSGTTFIGSLLFICPLVILATIFSFGIGNLCFLPLYIVVFGFQIYFGVKANQGEYVEIPVLTNLARGWGWL